MIGVKITDSGGSGKGSCIHEKDLVRGQIVYTREYADRESTTRPFLNDTYGNDLAQAATFGGTPVNIHDGGDVAGWTGTATAGTWDFADTTTPSSGTKCVSLTSANNNDSANFAGGSVTGSSYSAITMQLQLDNFSGTQHTIVLQFNNGGVPIGVSVNLNSYIDTSILGSYQGIVIPLSDLEIENLSFDGCDITLIRTGGTKPTFRIDLLQIEETGGAIRFQVKPDPREVFYVEEIRFVFADNVTGNAALDYSKILGVTLANGLVITRIDKNGPVVGRSISSVYDFYSFGFTRELIQDNGVNTMLVVSIKFTRPLTLNALFEETINIDVNDDLSGFLSASAIARGESEPINTHGKLITE